MRREIQLLRVAFLTASAGLATGSAQTVAGTIVGSVFDASGAIVPQARVEAINARGPGFKQLTRFSIYSTSRDSFNRTPRPARAISAASPMSAAAVTGSCSLP